MVAALLGLGFGPEAWPASSEPAGAPSAPKESAPWQPLACDAVRNDAGLRDVFFITPQRGWAVGDRGTIWHTCDGGKEWVPQRSRVACRLEAVCFATPDVGWTVGGTSQPYLHTGVGVLLATRDGGQNWTQETRPRLPWLKRAGLFQDRAGWALGGTSGLLPSGVYRTETFGAQWIPVSGPCAGGWTAGDLLGPADGALADANGNLALLRQGRLDPAAAPPIAPRRVTRIRLAPGGKGWSVGEGGLVLRTADGGATWQPPPQPLPEDIARHFDFAAMAVHGSNVWIAGTPGTRIFYSPDDGHSWFAAATGQSLPIWGLCFCDPHHGFAAGSLGTILATTDGGQTWIRQRAGGARAAVLGIFARAADVPFELLARLAGNDGYLTAVEVVCRHEQDAPQDEAVGLADRLAEAVLAVGGSEAHLAWQFPLHPAGLSLGKGETAALWDAVHAGRGMAELEAWLVGRIRMWRPTVIVLGELSAGATRPEVALIQQAVLRAVHQAADPAAYDYQIKHLGFCAWQVQSVFTAVSSSAQATVVIPATQLADRLGSSVGDLAEDARALIADRFQRRPEALAFDLLWEYDSADGKGRELLLGLDERPGAEARRHPLFPDPKTVERVRRLSQKRRTAEILFQRAERDSRLAATLASDAEQLMAGLDIDSAAELLDGLAQRAWQEGRFPLAAEIDELLVRRFPERAFGRAAMLRLITYYGSGEAGLAMRAGQRDTAGQGSNFGPVAPPVDRQWQLQRAASLAGTLEQHHPDLFATPRVSLLVASVQRQLRQRSLADRLLEPLRHRSSQDLWRAWAQGERWLADGRGACPKPVLRCARVSAPPRLDGRLEDEVWQGASAAPLRSPLGEDTSWPAAVRLATDGRFLYWAIHARWAGQSKTDKPLGPRPRDGDLSAYDRVELLLDVDRDLATWFRLTIDSRGWTAEDCGGNAAWDPTWYVAAGRDDDAWIAEAAIPLDQLGNIPAPGAAWAAGIQRIVPGTGFQSWTWPAAVAVCPEGFGYLRFE